MVDNPYYIPIRIWKSIVATRDSLSNLLHGQPRLAFYKLALAIQSSLLPQGKCYQAIGEKLDEFIRKRIKAKYRVQLDYLGFAEEQLTIKHYFKYESFRPKANWNIMDIGANVGEYAIIAARMANLGNVVAIEPDPRSFQRLQHNIKVNNLENLILLRMAVGNRAGAVNIHDGFLVRIPRDDSESRAEVTTIDSIIEGMLIRRLDLIKIDIEGWEYFALEGAEHTIDLLSPRFIIECHSKKLSDMISRFLRDRGYLVSISVLDNSLYNNEITCYAFHA